MVHCNLEWRSRKLNSFPKFHSIHYFLVLQSVQYHSVLHMDIKVFNPTFLPSSTTTIRSFNLISTAKSISMFLFQSLCPLHSSPNLSSGSTRLSQVLYIYPHVDISPLHLKKRKKKLHIHRSFVCTNVLSGSFIRTSGMSSLCMCNTQDLFCGFPIHLPLFIVRSGLEHR